MTKQFKFEDLHKGWTAFALIVTFLNGYILASNVHNGYYILTIINIIGIAFAPYIIMNGIKIKRITKEIQSYHHRLTSDW